MLFRALLQTSLVLWLAEQTLQGGVKPQSVSYGRMLASRGVGIGMRNGAGVGALGALGSRYAADKAAMKSGMGRYAGAQLGVGGYRGLGMGGRGLGMRQGGYGGQGMGAYGAGMGLGTGLNGLGMGLGQGAKRAYGAGLGTLPGYGAGMGYARPGIGFGYSYGLRFKGLKSGVPTADLGGRPEMANLGQAEAKGPKSGGLGPQYGKPDGTLGHEMPILVRGGRLGPSAHESQGATGFRPYGLPHGGEGKSIEDKQRKLMAALEAQRQIQDPRRGVGSQGAALSTGGVRPQLPHDKDDGRHLGLSPQVQGVRDYDLPLQQQKPRGKDCGPNNRGLPDGSELDRLELLGSDAQRAHSLGPHADKEGKYLGRGGPQAQGERPYQLPLSQPHDYPRNMFPLQNGQANIQGVREPGLIAKEKSGSRVGHGSPNLQVQQGAGGYGAVVPGERGTQSLGIVEGQEVPGLTADGHNAKQLAHAEHDFKKSKSLVNQGQTGGKAPATSYIGGAGNYLGTGLGVGGYGADLGQGAYLGGAAGKLASKGLHSALGQGGYPQGAGYGEGAYLGAMAGNGYGDASKALAGGYGNGYGDAYGAGLGYPSELADVATNKAGKSRALGAGAYAGQAGVYGAGAAPYGNAPVVPAGLEGDGGYPYGAQQVALGAEGVKPAKNYGYGAQLGVEALAEREQAGKYGAGNGGYKG